MTDTLSHARPARLRQVSTPAALALADLAAVFEDLQTALRCCERLMAELGADGGPDDLALETLWTTTLLSYARCFAPGSRGSGLTEDDVTATGLAGDVLGWHRVLVQLRGHYADPATNPRETFSVGVAQDDAGAADGIAVTSARQPAVDELSVRQTGAIAFELSRLLDKRIAEHQQLVYTAVRALSPADLGKLPLLEVAEPEPVPPSEPAPEPEPGPAG